MGREQDSSALCGIVRNSGIELEIFVELRSSLLVVTIAAVSCVPRQRESVGEQSYSLVGILLIEISSNDHASDLACAGTNFIQLGISE